MKEVLLTNCEKNFINKSVEQGTVCIFKYLIVCKSLKLVKMCFSDWMADVYLKHDLLKFILHPIGVVVWFCLVKLGKNKLINVIFT